MTTLAASNSWRRHKRHGVVAALLIGGLILAPSAVSATVVGQLNLARQAYTAGRYAEVVRRLTPLLYPRLQFSDEAAALEARKLLALSHLFEGSLAAADRELLAIITLRPDFEFDALVDPQVAIERLEAVKRSNAEKLRQIRQRIASERRKREQAAARRNSKRSRASNDKAYWLNFVPFGAGQFQNKQPTKGWLLFGLQMAFGLTSVTAAIWHRAVYNEPVVSGSAEQTAARRLAVVQVTSGALFWAAFGYGVIDALWHYRSRRPGDRARRQSVITPHIDSRRVGLDLNVAF